MEEREDKKIVLLNLHRSILKKMILCFIGLIGAITIIILNEIYQFPFIDFLSVTGGSFCLLFFIYYFLKDNVIIDVIVSLKNK